MFLQKLRLKTLKRKYNHTICVPTYRALTRNKLYNARNYVFSEIINKQSCSFNFLYSVITTLFDYYFGSVSAVCRTRKTSSSLVYNKRLKVLINS